MLLSSDTRYDEKWLIVSLIRLLMKCRSSQYLKTLHVWERDSPRPARVIRCLLLEHTSLAYRPDANGPVSMHTNTRVCSLGPGFDSAYFQVHRRSEPIEGVRSPEPALASTHYAPQ